MQQSEVQASGQKPDSTVDTPFEAACGLAYQRGKLEGLNEKVNGLQTVIEELESQLEFHSEVEVDQRLTIKRLEAELVREQEARFATDLAAAAAVYDAETVNLETVKNILTTLEASDHEIYAAVGGAPISLRSLREQRRFDLYASEVCYFIALGEIPASAWMENMEAGA